MPHYDRNFAAPRSNETQGESIFDDEEDAIDGAAQALREVEVQAVRPKVESAAESRLDDKSIDELRALAAKLNIPECGTLTVKAELIAAISQRM